MKDKISYLAHTARNAGLYQKSAGLSQKAIWLTPNSASGILCAQAHGKVYFECLEMFSGTQNSLPLHFVAGEGRYSEVVRPV